MTAADPETADVKQPVNPDSYKQFDTESGENQYYHSVCKTQVDFSFFYDYHVPHVLLPKRKALQEEAEAKAEE